MHYIQEPSLVFFLIEGVFITAALLIVWNGMISPLFKNYFKPKAPKPNPWHTANMDMNW